MDLATILANMDFSGILLSILSGVFAVLVAWVALRGKDKEVTAQHIKTLTDGQANRITALEGRLTDVEARLSETRLELRLESRRSDELLDALRDAINYLEDLNRWVERGSVGDMPKIPDLVKLKKIANDR